MLREAVESARGQQGALVLVEGTAGIGKSALLERGAELGRSAEVRVLAACGGELERDFPFGVVRQLFEPVLRGVTGRRRRELFSGAAGLAAPLLLPESAGEAARRSSGDSLFPVLHGLYWLTANLADREPLLIVIDDLHWVDSSSLRFVLFAARRLRGLPVALVTAVRTGEPGVDGDLLARFAAERDTRMVRLGALSQGAVARLVGGALGGSPEECFVRACREATGGVPFLLAELLSALAAQGVQPTAEMSPRVGEVGPATVAKATLLRLARLPDAAGALARAVAVLGGAATLHRAARLAALEELEVLAAADALAGANVLRARRPLEFMHPIVRTAVYEDLPPGWRSAAHARAARMLEDEGADPDAIAVQLLASEPAGMTDVAERLRAAAVSALARGAPESAAVYLRRALAEGVGDDEARAALLYELGRAESLLREPGATERLEQARALLTDPRRRILVGCELAEVLAFAGRWEPLSGLLESVLSETGGRDAELRLRAETLWALAASFDPRLVVELEGRLPLLRAAAEGGGAARGLSLVLAWVIAARGPDARKVLRLVERGLDQGRFLGDFGVDSWPLVQALRALVIVEEDDRAAALIADIAAEARKRGSCIGLAMVAGFNVWLETRAGNLIAAEADQRAALELAREHDLPLPAAVALWHGSDALVERLELADIAAHAAALHLSLGLAPTFIGAITGELRGRLRLLEGSTAGAIDDLRECGAIFESLHLRNPPFTAWRCTLATALSQVEPTEARSYAAEELNVARRSGSARAIGIALRTAGIVSGGQPGRALLEEALKVLEPSPARLEYARACVELGTALRRVNERAAARDPLRAGLDLAHRCGATRLAERAVTELAATGAKPRRLRITGRDALTPSEVRIARMAADGLSNRDIAQAMFVTAKTVENHLGRVYHKLEVSGRAALGDALERERPVR